MKVFVLAPNERKCKTCNSIKNIEDFHFQNKRKNIRHYECKLCRNEKEKLRNNPDKNRKKYIKNQQTESAKRKEFLKKQGLKCCSECFEVKIVEEFSLNGKCRRSKCKKCMRKKYNTRIQKDSQFKLRHNIARRILLALNGTSKQLPTMKLVGCSIEHLKKHLENKFQEGMTWNNHGKNGWHIDHIKPCSSFDLVNLEEQKKCFNYNNLQPLWAEDNLKKGATL